MICKVCKKYFNAKKENRYVVTKTPVGLNILVEGSKVYECFDCPKCGCQNIVNVREENGKINENEIIKEK